jgi:hypothetical protein
MLASARVRSDLQEAARELLTPKPNHLSKAARLRDSIVVVFPAPLGPIRPKISPLLTSNDTSSTATVVP